ncbi:MAG: hypothetical protein D6732_24585 [Methanobacteriota archaeon]|nr:MAG: hypothetical protein D6732_24585 [Euryarchaeota archaeon]
MGLRIPDDGLFEDYDPKIEALQELSNIGVGHAATALSQLLNRRVDMSIPRVRFVPIADVGEYLAETPEEVVAGILQETSEDEKGVLNLLLIFDFESIKQLLGTLVASPIPSRIEDLDELSRSIIKETGNILLIHTISAINSFTEAKWFPHAPSLAIDMVGALTDELVSIEGDTGDKFLLVEVDIFTDEEKIKGDILMLPDRKAMNALMTTLYGENWEAMY